MAKFFNKNLKHIRKLQNISQQELADKLNVDRSSISRWENEDMEATVDKAIEIANILGVPVSLFLATDMTNLDIDAIYDLYQGVSYKEVLKAKKIRDELDACNLEEEINNGTYIDPEWEKELLNFRLEDDIKEMKEKENHEKYKSILKEKGLMDENGNIDEISFNKLMKLADMMKDFNEKD